MAKVVKIEVIPNYQGWVHAVEVAEDESFVANGLVVHNCQEGVNQDADFKVINKSMDNDLVSLYEYFRSFASLFARYHKLGEWTPVLYNTETEEVLLED